MSWKLMAAFVGTLAISAQPSVARAQAPDCFRESFEIPTRAVLGIACGSNATPVFRASARNDSDRQRLAFDLPPANGVRAMLLGYDAGGNNVCSIIWPNSANNRFSPRCNAPLVSFTMETID
jgi:hypothetical protein